MCTIQMCCNLSRVVLYMCVLPSLHLGSLAIVYNVFSDTFAQGVGADIGAASLGRLMVTMPTAYLGTTYIYLRIHTHFHGIAFIC